MSAGGRPGYRSRVASRRKRPTSRTPAPAREAAYRRAFEEHGDAAILLDWRKLRQRRWTGLAGPDGEPALWPGTLYLFGPEELQEENRRINERAFPAAMNRMLFIGGNACGIVYALDGGGRVIAFDEIEAPDQDPRLGQVLADSIDELLAAREDTR